LPHYDTICLRIHLYASNFRDIIFLKSFPSLQDNGMGLKVQWNRDIIALVNILWHSQLFPIIYVGYYEPSVTHIWGKRQNSWSKRRHIIFWAVLQSNSHCENKNVTYHITPISVPCVLFLCPGHWSNEDNASRTLRIDTWVQNDVRKSCQMSEKQALRVTSIGKRKFDMAKNRMEHQL